MKLKVFLAFFADVFYSNRLKCVKFNVQVNFENGWWTGDVCPLFACIGISWRNFAFISGLEYVKQLCVPEYNTVEMEVASK